MKWLLIAGRIGAGKSTVATNLADVLDGEVVRVREVLTELVGAHVTSRRDLQARGAELDRRTNGRWLLDYLQQLPESDRPLIIDSVRTVRQTAAVLDRGPAFLVFLEARPRTRRKRFERARLADAVKRSMSFDQANRYPTEQCASDLRALADCVVSTDDRGVHEVVHEILAAMPT